ncbi:MAG: peptide chain release factor 2, partial [Pyrinomonadaceae bacterium]|nr:peptide chain release factor 2 [Phycisphaerales bacterium]
TRDAEGFWNSQEKAQKVLTRIKHLKSQTDPLIGVAKDFEDAKVAYDMSREDGDKDLLAEADEQLFKLQARMEKVEMQSLLSGKHDAKNCFLTIAAGAGGTEANDWAEMLFRMYIYYCEKMNFEVIEVEKGFGTEVGIDSVTLHIKAPFAFGYFNCERGTHRLARVSPFNAQGKRQTSFATVDVTPEMEDNELVIPEKDLDIMPFVRASGPGGQNVNKVATAIRITHIPTGIQVVANSFRDQPQNRKQAMTVLMGKLQALEDERREKEIAAATGGAVERGWGTQIRSYVFYDNRVKDHRTGYESTDYERVLRGDIQGFVDAELQRKRKIQAERASRASQPH